MVVGVPKALLRVKFIANVFILIKFCFKVAKISNQDVDKELLRVTQSGVAMGQVGC